MPVADDSFRKMHNLQKSVSMELSSIDSTRTRQRRLPNVPNFEVSKLGAFIGQRKSRRTPAVIDDPFRFSPPGMDFRAKLIGVQDVNEARGERMCQDAMRVLKAVIKSTGRHKQRIVVNVSVEGVKLMDERAIHVLYSFPVHKISFVARDITDSRAFGFVVGTPGTQHRFYGIKTEKTSDIVVFNIRDMFQIVFEMRKRQQEMMREEQVPSCDTSQIVEKAWVSFPTEPEKNSSETANTVVISNEKPTKPSEELLLIDYISPVANPVNNSFPPPVSRAFSSNESSGIFSDRSFTTSELLFSGDSWSEENKNGFHQKLEPMDAALNPSPFSFHQNGNISGTTSDPTAAEQIVPPDPFDTSHISHILKQTNSQNLSAPPPSFAAAPVYSNYGSGLSSAPTSGGFNSLMTTEPSFDQFPFSSNVTLSAPATPQQTFQQNTVAAISDNNGLVTQNSQCFDLPPLPPRPRPADGPPNVLLLPKPPVVAPRAKEAAPASSASSSDPFSDEFFQ